MLIAQPRFLLIPGALRFYQTANQHKNPLAATRGRAPFCRLLVRTAAQYVRCQKAFGTFLKLILHCLAFVKGPVAIFLDSGKVHKDVFAGRPLNEAIAFGSVKPLDCSLLFHKCNSFRLSFRLKFSAGNFRAKKKVVALPARWLFSATDRLPCRKAPNKATPATGSFGEFKLLYKNINLNAPCGLIAGS